MSPLLIIIMLYLKYWIYLSTNCECYFSEQVKCKKVRHSPSKELSIIKIVATRGFSVGNLKKMNSLRMVVVSKFFDFLDWFSLSLFFIAHMFFRLSLPSLIQSQYGVSQRYRIFFILTVLHDDKNKRIHSYIDIRILSFVYCMTSIEIVENDRKLFGNVF